MVQEELGGSRWGSLGQWEVSAAKDAEGGKEKGKKKNNQIELESTREVEEGKGEEEEEEGGNRGVGGW